MNRFLPDNWLEALMRPVAMAFPDAWVYIEIIAPDLRFVFLIVLAAVAGLVAWRKGWQRGAIWPLTGFLAVAFIPWLATTGNGRYFIPVLLLSGLLCVAFVKFLPLTRSFRLAIVLLMVCLQGFLVAQNHPWQPSNPWTFISWKSPPYFDLKLDVEAATQPATYVTMSVISYSLLAPLFPPDSRWVNVSSLLGVANDAADMQRVKAFLDSATKLRLLVPAIPSVSDSEGLPNDAAIDALNQLLRQHQLGVKRGSGCRLLPSSSLNTFSHVDKTALKKKQGFWACPLDYPATTPLPSGSILTPLTSQAFQVIEQQCPRFFPPGLTQVTAIQGGAMRHYQSADMKLYVFDDGSVYYKYFRALNPVLLGTVDDILKSGYRMDCENIRGRSGLPWERQI